MAATADCSSLRPQEGIGSVHGSFSPGVQANRSVASDRSGEATVRPAVGVGDDRLGAGLPAWASLGAGNGGQMTKSDHVKGCRCCFPPDHMFEDACRAIVALDVPGFGSVQAEKFVRLCGGGVGTMTLSKGKTKAAQKLRKGMSLSPAEINAMQGRSPESAVKNLHAMLEITFRSPSRPPQTVELVHGMHLLT